MHLTQVYPRLHCACYLPQPPSSMFLSSIRQLAVHVLPARQLYELYCLHAWSTFSSVRSSFRCSVLHVFATVCDRRYVCYGSASVGGWRHYIERQPMYCPQESGMCLLRVSCVFVCCCFTRKHCIVQERQVLSSVHIFVRYAVLLATLEICRYQLVAAPEALYWNRWTVSLDTYLTPWPTKAARPRHLTWHEQSLASKPFLCSTPTAAVSNERLYNLCNWVTSGFLHSVNQISFLWDVTQHVLVDMYRRFGTNYRFHLQGQSNYCMTLFDPRGWDR
jgi:hypothetical protein